MTPIMSTTRRRPERVLPALALLLGCASASLGAASADPLPEGTAAPNAPDAQTAPDTAQPPPVMEQQDVPPVAPKAEPAQPEAEKPATDASAAPKADEAPKGEAPKDEAPENVEPVAPTEAFAVLGKKVYGPDGKDILGSIIDILVDDQGHPRAAVVDFGGFLGVGSRKIAVDWQLMKFHPGDAAVPIVLDLDRRQIQAAPEYKDPTRPAEVVMPDLVGVSATPPVPGVVAIPSPSVETAAPPESPPPAAPAASPSVAPPPVTPPPMMPRGDVAAPASPPDAAPQSDADKHAN